MTLTAEETTEMLVLRFQQHRTPELQEELVQRHLKLVGQIARSYRDRGGELEDLMQVGSIGLLHAIERFSPRLGRNFEAYAGTLISGEIMHFLRDHSFLVRPPRELVELRSTVRAATAKLSQATERAPTLDELATATGLPPGKVAEVLELETTTRMLSLDDEGDDEGEGRSRYQLVDSKYRSFQLATEDRIMLAQAMARLKHVSREVIEFTFYQDLTQTEIAKKLGISQMQVSRRLRSATEELWKILNSRLF